MFHLHYVNRDGAFDDIGRGTLEDIHCVKDTENTAEYRRSRLEVQQMKEMVKIHFAFGYN